MLAGNESIILIELESDKGGTSDNIHSPFVMDDENSDAENMENIFSSYCNQKKVSRHFLMDQSVEVILTDIDHDIDVIKEYNVKADGRLQLLEAIKDGLKWTRDSHKEWAGYNSVRCKDCSGGFTRPNTECLYFQQHKYRNRVSFKNNGICDYCPASGDHLPCFKHLL